MSGFVIEKNVPFRKATRAPWKDMGEGDSLWFPFSPRFDGDTAKTYSQAIYNRAWMWSKRRNTGFKWDVEVRTEQGVVGVRIWRRKP